MKVSLLMPTYNDLDSIEETLLSIVNQTYENWELLVMDDGSTDNTKSVIDKYQKAYENKIFYFKQKNMDQLRALKNLIPYISGDIVFIIHSDDLIYDKSTLEFFMNKIKIFDEYDAYYGKIRIIDKNSIPTGKILTPKKLEQSEKTLAKTLLWMGRNSYFDYSYFKVDFFKNHVKERYLINNTPYWFSDNYKEIPKTKYFNRIMADYRIHDDNYINSSIGNSSVLSGNMRVFLNLMKYYSIPLFKLQFLLFRLFNKTFNKFEYRPFYLKIETKQKSKLYKFAAKKRLGDEWKNNLFYKSLYLFLVNSEIQELDYTCKEMPDKIYLGCDSKKFFNDLSSEKLDRFYIDFMGDLQIGFNTINVRSEQIKIMQDILTFYGIAKYVELKVINT